MPGNTALQRTAAWFKRAAIDPFIDFMKRPGWLAILIFVVLYKLADALIGNMANPFYVSLGFTKIEVANITKLFGFIATLAGVALGGLIVRRIGFYRSLLIGGILHGASNLMFAVQAMAGHDLGMLTLTIFVDHFTGGLSAAALVGYLSSLCNVAFTATQYALLSSLAALPSKLMSSPAGWLADRMDWVSFFVLMTLAAVPGILMVLWLMRRFPLRLPVSRPALADG
jgi:PAT family beta-lactamase induction signal transducer AmpG